MTSQRRTKIKILLSTKPYISLKELMEMFPDVSSMTLRRDIEYLEREGEAVKVRGGARSTRFITTAHDVSITQRMQENIESKDRVARAAAGFLETGRSIFLDSGSTLAQIVSHVKNERYTFTTTSPMLALDLAKVGLPTVNLVGGRLDGEYQAISGLQAMKYISDINIDIAILCPSGLSAKSGFTGGSYNECELKRVIVENSRSVMMLMDISKIEKSLPYTFCHLDRVDILICDGELPPPLMAQVERHHVNFINVSKQ